MAKPPSRAYSRYTVEALALLGQLIHAARVDRKLTAAELATRAGISRPLLRRIENGDPGCSIGAVFEAAVVAGVPLFEPERSRLQTQLAHSTEKLTLLPKAVRKPRKAVKDDF